MIYLGMQDQFYTFNMFDAQAWYARDYILGKISLPSKDIMTADSQKWRQREEELVSDEDMIWFQGDYVKDLIKDTDYPSFDIEGVNNTFMEWEKHKHEDIMGFRNHSYKSLMTGKMSPQHHTPWIEELDDSLETYLHRNASQ
jgi:trimethylamine monooxygenase